MKDIDIHSHFNSVIGQERPKTRLLNNLLSVQNDGEAKSVMVTGRTGLGKTHLADSIANAYQSLGFKLWNFGCPSEITGAPYVNLCEDLQSVGSGLKVAIRIGEAHRLRTISRVQIARIHKFIMGATDEKRKGTEISINDGEIRCTINWHNLVFILDTNFPAKLEEGKQSTSFRERFLFETLDDYTPEECAEILRKMVARKGLRFGGNAEQSEKTLGMIVACARGTARPLQNIVDELDSMSNANGGKDQISRKEVVSAIRLSNLFPRGLTKHEVQTLQYCATPKRQAHLMSLFPNLEATDLRKSLAFLQTCRDGDGFITSLTGGFQTSPLGTKYLAAIKEDGFKLPL